MPDLIRRVSSWCLPLLLAVAAPAGAQRPIPSPKGGPIVKNPAPLVAPAIVTAAPAPGNAFANPASGIAVSFSAVASSLGPVMEHQVSRSDAGGPEVIIHKDQWSRFVSRGMPCTPSAQPSCIYLDSKVVSHTSYTYWVRAVIGAAVSPPSAPATATAR
ncbi:MAG: hypothetical protein AB7R55_01585 [Gemmatimonadales bacterium]